MLTTLGLLALAGAGANAIVIPSTVSLDESGGHLIDPYAQLLQVPCLGCMYAQPHDGGFIWTKGVENVLLVNISVGSNPSTLEMNGAHFYPLPLNAGFEAGFMPPPIYVSQVPASVSLADIKAHPAQYTSTPLLVTAFRSFLGPAQTVNYEGHELLTITLKLVALEQQEINVPELSITVLKDTDGNLAILRIDQGPVSDNPKAGNKECNHWPLLCKWKAIVANRISTIKGSFKGRKPCGGMMRKPGLAHSGGKEVDHEQEDHHGGKHPKHRGHGHSHGHGHHSWHRHHRNRLHRILRAIARVLLTVLVPILIGVAAGILLYLVGYVIGTVLGFIAGRLVGRRPRYQAIALTDDTEGLPRDSMDKFEYRDEEEQDGEAPPEYVEVVSREVPAEKE